MIKEERIKLIFRKRRIGFFHTCFEEECDLSTTIVALVNQKGGCTKTASAVNLGVGLAREGKRVLLVDNDPQASLTVSLGFAHPETLFPTLADLMVRTVNGEPNVPGEGILHHPEGVDLLPANTELAGVEVALANVADRHTILKRVLQPYRDVYTHILIDCGPSMGMLTLNAMAAADRIIIPMQAQYLPVKGVEQLLKNISNAKRFVNPGLKIDGILISMLDARTKSSRYISTLIHEVYGGHIKVFDTTIPRSIRVAEAAAYGRSVFAHDPHGRAAMAYEDLTKEVLDLEKKRQRAKSDMVR